jgi:tRNA(Ile)-lysidine synthase
MLLKSVLVDVCGREKDLEAVHIKDLQELFEKQVGRKLDLPYQMEAKRVYEGIWIGEKRSETEIIEEEVWDLSEEKREISIAGYQIQCEQMEAAEMCAKECEKSHTKYFSCDIIKNGVTFRTRRSGDYITIHPDGRTQKLKTYFINEKIPQEERDRILLVADGSHVLWIVGHRAGCAYEVKENTKRVLKIHVNKGESYGRDN